MTFPQPLRDPLGHHIQLPAPLSTISTREYDDISQVITTPAFVIKEQNQKLYFFRMINWELNIMVQAQLIGNLFIAIACVENPTVELISRLLKKGSLISFHPV